MTRDEWVIASLVTAFAALCTAHAALVLGLASRVPRRRAALAAVVPPLAPWWGARAGMRARSVCWVVSAAAYAVCRWLASR